jgi:hypothetical protein
MAVDTQGKNAWTGRDVPEKEINLLNQRVIQFTDIEDTFLDVWLQLENANLDELAAKVLNAGLLFEHYLSQLPNDPTQRAPEQMAQLETYRSDAGTALDEGRAALASIKTITGGSTSITATLLPTVAKTGTFTLWFFLAFQEYLAVTAGNLISTLGYGIAALAELFLGLSITHYASNKSSKGKQ